ncbi:glycoside hydrolase family 2 TIM barrel-domain containing protein [Chitinophaga sp.]|uniref:glycoside hydrolase family 2 protein n=1 Tax=Chitinophaga sp. TaxID=1869181 RepID=UPI0031D4E5FD
MKKTFLTLCIVLTGVYCLYAQETEIQYLSGTNWDFYCTAGANSGKWTTIPVPACWELQGFGKYDYGFAKDSVRGKESGCYKYAFHVPRGWKGKQINIVFEGVMTDAAVRINGKSAGAMHQGAFYAFKYDITHLLKSGSNLLEVKVDKQSANRSVNAAERQGDFWIFGGIFRPVYLEALPAEHIEQVVINANADGHFTAQVKAPGEVTMQLYDANGKKIGTPLHHLDTIYHDIQPWSAEFPNLYTAVFTLKTHIVRQRFGFRTVEVRPRDGVYINGAKIKFKGVNRHSFTPETGRTTTKQVSIDDVLLMKEMNMNAVRMSHYPPDAHFLDVCDSLGMYVIDELAGWHGHYDTPTGTKLVKEMITHDVNHPSIIFWANGNEGGHNLELDHLFPEQDLQRRPVLHPWLLFSGIETQHYREYNYGIGNYENGRDIVMPTEFLHGQFDGGHGAGLEDYWEKMWRNPLSAGGFLWDFADEGVVRHDLNDSIDTDHFRGADGIVGPHHEKEGSFYTVKEVWSPIHLDANMHVENRYHFTNTDQCTFSYKLGADSGQIAAPHIAPGQNGDLHLRLPANWKDYDVLYITAKDPYHRELFTWSFPITTPAATAQKLLDTSGSTKPVVKETDSLWQVTANKIQLAFNKYTGLLEGVPLHHGPILQEGENNFSGFSYAYEGNNLVIRSSFDRQKSYNTLQWTIYPSGIVRLHVNYFPGAYFTSFTGLNFSFPEKDILGVDYMGNGPYRVWKNRLKGTRFGIWHKDYNDTETGERWNYPEFKGYYSQLYWCKFITRGKPFTVYTTTEDVFLRLFTPAWKTDQWHNYEPIFPNGDISFMQGISAIGTKTQRSETTGPMGMKNIFYDYEKDPARALQLTLYFDFSGK